MRIRGSSWLLRACAFLASVAPLDSCAATGGGTTPTTCAACDPNIISLVPNPQPGSFAATLEPTDPNPANGCLRIFAVCTADAGNIASMLFNVGQGGPAENNDNVQVVRALLECMNGAWFYDNVRQVNQVSCTQAPAPGK